MDLHNRLKELNNLPENHAVKTHIYEGIHQNKKASLGKWKEAFLIIAISAIALFLVFVPESERQSQTSSTAIQAVYKYSLGKEGEFSARSSSLYTFVDKVKDPTILGFFEYFSTYVKEADGSLGKNITDILVIRNGQEEHYQLSETGMLRVDTGQFYIGNADMYRYELVLFNLDSSIPIKWIAFLTFIISILNWISNAYYKHHHIKSDNLLKTNPWLLVLNTIVVATIFAWAFWIGPMYKPLLIVLTLLWWVATWNATKKNSPTYPVYKFETIKLIILTTSMIFTIISL